MIVEVERLAEPMVQLDAFAALQALGIDRAQRFARLHQILGVGGLAVPLEVDAARGQPRGLGGRGQLDRFTRQLGGAVVLAEVVEPAGLRQRIGRRVRVATATRIPTSSRSADRMWSDRSTSDRGRPGPVAVRPERPDASNE